MTYVLPQQVYTAVEPGKRLLGLWELAGGIMCAHYCFVSPLTRTFHVAEHLHEVPESQRRWFAEKLKERGWSVAEIPRRLRCASGEIEVDTLVRLPAS